MVKMFVLICVVWVSRHDGGERMYYAMYYANIDQCRADIPKSRFLIETGIFDNFGEEPVDYTISASCFEGV